MKEGGGRFPRKPADQRGIVRHDSHTRKSRVTRPGIEPVFFNSPELVVGSDPRLKRGAVVERRRLERARTNDTEFHNTMSTYMQTNDTQFQNIVCKYMQANGPEFQNILGKYMQTNGTEFQNSLCNYMNTNGEAVPFDLVSPLYSRLLCDAKVKLVGLGGRRSRQVESTDPPPPPRGDKLVIPDDALRNEKKGRGGKREIPEKTRRPAASCGAIPPHARILGATVGWRIGKFRVFIDLLARLHSPVYTRASDVCSLAAAPESSQCYYTLASMALYLFPCKSAIGSELSGELSGMRLLCVSSSVVWEQVFVYMAALAEQWTRRGEVTSMASPRGRAKFRPAPLFLPPSITTAFQRLCFPLPASVKTDLALTSQATSSQLTPSYVSDTPSRCRLRRHAADCTLNQQMKLFRRGIYASGEASHLSLGRLLFRHDVQSSGSPQAINFEVTCGEIAQTQPQSNPRPHGSAQTPHQSSAKAKVSPGMSRDLDAPAVSSCRVGTVRSLHETHRAFKRVSINPVLRCSVWPAGWIMLLWNTIAVVMCSPIPAPEALVYATPVDDMDILRNRIVRGCETIRNFPGIHQCIRVSICRCIVVISRIHIRIISKLGGHRFVVGVLGNTFGFHFTCSQCRSDLYNS
ncbi:hypothetical protein PR048_000360 [Dryococelus australis]|uniref:Uncharacterized protein n=1 Tax=Dryococelus australis TaxID=614101 RepID=A0ABQ9IEI8_9NEOP|nr:hypothetical protein PR048_000360 [Dryococelus australis]